MRKSEYRGWSADKGWVYGSLVTYGFTDKFPTYAIVPEYASALYGVEVDPWSVGRYTGAVDANNERIYEGDIMYTEDGNLITVSWNRTTLRFNLYPYVQSLLGLDLEVQVDCGSLTYSEGRNFEVVGNVYKDEDRFKAKYLEVSPWLKLAEIERRKY